MAFSKLLPAKRVSGRGANACTGFRDGMECLRLEPVTLMARRTATPDAGKSKRGAQPGTAAALRYISNEYYREDGKCMLELLTWLESSAIGVFIRESSVWTYGIVNLLHVLGLSTLFGSILVLDLRLLGVAGNVPLASITRLTVPVAGAGLALALISGVGMITANATEYYGNVMLFVKFPAIAIGIINAVVIQFLPGWKGHTTRDLSSAERRQLAVAAGISLFSWFTVMVAGRMIAYWY
jgi:hypothetical protein